MVVATSVAGPTASERTASTSWRRTRRPVSVRGSPAEPTRIASDAAEHFCPACPNADRTRSATARSRSADGVTTSAFLPDVSASTGRDGFHRAKSCAVSIEPVSTTRATSSCVTRRVPSSSSGTRTYCTTSVTEPASSPGKSPGAAATASRRPAWTASTATSRQRGVGGAGLASTADPAASAASTPPTGIATGKFHGGVTSVTPSGANRAPGTWSSSSAERA